MLIVYIAAFYLVANLFGILIEKIKIPRIYAALFLGVGLSSTTLVNNVVATDPIKYLSLAGMVSLLFLLGYGLDIKQLKEQSRLIVKVTIYVISTECIAGTLILHFVFHVEWLLAGVIAISFATVGEVALLPLLKEFKLLKTKLGQTILGVAILDDIVEILAFILLISFFGSLKASELLNESLPLIAIVSGVALKNTVKLPEKFDKAINFIALFVFGPIFFFTAGTEADLSILFRDFFLIIGFTLVIKATKISSAYLASHKQLGTKKSIVLGVSLGIKFSTSIIILIILLQKGLITEELFSVLIGIKVVFKFVVPLVLTYLLTKWRLHLVDVPKVK